MTTSSNGRKQIEISEGLELEAYKKDSVWTIGYGHTTGVKEFDVCTAAEADVWLTSDIKWAEKCVSTSVHIVLNQNQFDALVSFTFNLGVGNLLKSSVLDYTNKSNFPSAAKSFLLWNEVDGKFSQGVYNRRVRESKLFLTPVN